MRLIQIKYFVRYSFLLFIQHLMAPYTLAKVVKFEKSLRFVRGMFLLVRYDLGDLIGL